MHDVPKQPWPRIEKMQADQEHALVGVIWKGNAIITNKQYLMEVPCVKMEGVLKEHELLPITHVMAYELSRRPATLNVSFTKQHEFHVSVNGQTGSVYVGLVEPFVATCRRVVTQWLGWLQKKSEPVAIDPKIMAPMRCVRFEGVHGKEVFAGRLRGRNNETLGTTLFMGQVAGAITKQQSLRLLRDVAVHLSEAAQKARDLKFAALRAEHSARMRS